MTLDGKKANWAENLSCHNFNEENIFCFNVTLNDF